MMLLELLVLLVVASSKPGHLHLLPKRSGNGFLRQPEDQACELGENVTMRCLARVASDYSWKINGITASFEQLHELEIYRSTNASGDHLHFLCTGRLDRYNFTCTAAVNGHPRPPRDSRPGMVTVLEATPEEITTSMSLSHVTTAVVLPQCHILLRQCHILLGQCHILPPLSKTVAIAT